MENGFEIPGAPKKTAYLVEKNLPGDKLTAVIRKAQKERADGSQVLLVRMNKNKKFQKQQLTEQGYTAFEEFYHDTEI